MEALGGLAQRFGLAPSVDFVRGVPFAEIHDISATMKLDDDLHLGLGASELGTEQYQRWDGTLTVESSQSGAQLLAGGTFSEAEAKQYASRITSWLGTRLTPSYYWIDADRTYPPGQVGDSLTNALSAATNIKELRAIAAQRSSSKYQNWLHYLLGTYASAALSTFDEALSTNSGMVVAKNPLEEYARSVESVLRHLKFKRVDLITRSLIFNNGIADLRFDQLSGGEKEIAFLIGQFDRYRMKSGITLIDEPELHLNPELVRRWISYLKGMTTTGQAWIATHSLEAIESAGFENTYILQKNPQTAESSSVRVISSVPAQRMLTSLLGFPAFSMAQRLFVLIEGERAGRERQRFEGLFPKAAYAFAAVGGCSEVKRLVGALQGVADDQGYDVRVFGIIDNDERPASDLSEFQSDPAYKVLPIFEIENLYLQPEAIQATSSELGNNIDPLLIVREAGDRFAGKWILERALLRVSWRPSELIVLKKTLMPLTWHDIGGGSRSEREALIGAIVSNSSDARNMIDAYEESVSEYELVRLSQSLWKRVGGKECSKYVSKSLGFTRTEFYENKVLSMWNAGTVPRPAELVELDNAIAIRVPPSSA